MSHKKLSGQKLDQSSITLAEVRKRWAKDAQSDLPNEAGAYRLLIPSILEEPTVNHIDLAQLLKGQEERFARDLQQRGQYEKCIVGSPSFLAVPSYVARFVQGFMEQGSVPRIDQDEHIKRNHAEDLNGFYRFVIALPGLQEIPPGNHLSASRWPWAMHTAARWMIANQQQKPHEAPPVGELVLPASVPYARVKGMDRRTRLSWLAERAKFLRGHVPFCKAWCFHLPQRQNLQRKDMEEARDQVVQAIADVNDLWTAALRELPESVTRPLAAMREGMRGHHTEDNDAALLADLVTVEDAARRRMNDEQNGVVIVDEDLTPAAIADAPAMPAVTIEDAARLLEVKSAEHIHRLCREGKLTRAGTSHVTYESVQGYMSARRPRATSPAEMETAAISNQEKRVKKAAALSATKWECTGEGSKPPCGWAGDEPGSGSCPGCGANVGPKTATRKTNAQRQ